MMNLFSLIAKQVRHRHELFDEEDRIMQKLVSVGYHLHEADAALTLMQKLVKQQDENFFGADTSISMRTMNNEERSRFTTEAFSFAVKLGHLGVLSEDQREELLEQAMNLYSCQIEIGHIKTLIAYLLFASVHDRQEDSAFSRMRSRRDTVWN